MVLNGKFALAGKLTDAELMHVVFKGHNNVADVYMFNNNITLTGDFSKPNTYTVTGSKLEEDYLAFVKAFDPLKEQITTLYNKLRFIQAGKEKDSLVMEFNICRGRVLAEASRYTKARPSSPVSSFVLYVLNPLFDGIDDLEARYNELKPAAQTGVYAKMVEQLISSAKVGAIGSMAADFTQNDTANNPVSLSSFRGKYVLVDFWASWCRPCRMENPNVVRAYNRFKDKNFTVLSVSLDMQKDNWVKAIKDDKLTWTNVSDLQYWNNAAAQLYRIQSVPQNILVDPEGKIIARNLRGEELEQALKSILK